MNGQRTSSMVEPSTKVADTAVGKTLSGKPTLVMHGDDDQIVPIAAAALLSIKLLKNGTLKVYKKFPHGMCTTHADVVNPDLLAFIKG